MFSFSVGLPQIADAVASVLSSISSLFTETGRTTRGENSEPETSDLQTLIRQLGPDPRFTSSSLSNDANAFQINADAFVNISREGSKDKLLPSMEVGQFVDQFLAAHDHCIATVVRKRKTLGRETLRDIQSAYRRIPSATRQLAKSSAFLKAAAAEVAWADLDYRYANETYVYSKRVERYNMDLDSIKSGTELKLRGYQPKTAEERVEQEKELQVTLTEDEMKLLRRDKLLQLICSHNAHV
jgi:hypothetical protein